MVGERYQKSNRDLNKWEKGEYIGIFTTLPDGLTGGDSFITGDWWPQATWSQHVDFQSHTQMWQCNDAIY